MKRVWILSPNAVPPELGSLNRHYKFSEYLINKGYDVLIFSSSKVHNTSINMIKDDTNYKIVEYGNVPFVFVKTRDYVGTGLNRVKSMLDYAFRTVTVSQGFIDQKPDIIYASSPNPLSWLSGYYLSKKHKAKFIAEIRDLWPETLVSMGRIKRNSLIAKMLYSLERFIYKKADRLVFTMPGGEEYVDELDLDTSKVRYVNNGLDLAVFNNNKKNLIYSDTELDNPDTFKVIYTGSMGQSNALRYLLDAANLLKHDRHIQFFMYGDGYQREELEKYAIDNQIKNVSFKGKVEKKYIPNILSKANLNIFTGQDIDLYKYGYSLNKMFEYFASGKPTLSNIQTKYDLLEEFKAGKSVKSGDAESLANGILEFYNMSEKDYNSYCQYAVEISKRFDYKLLSAKVEDIILEL